MDKIVRLSSLLKMGSKNSKAHSAEDSLQVRQEAPQVVAKFHLGEQLGEGANSQVFRGNYRGAEVAIKRILIGRQQVGEMNREIEAMQRLDHPNVLKLLYWEEQTDFRFLILPLCSGSLDDFIGGKYQGPMPEEWISLEQMAEGLNYIHSKSFVHRDIKPENVLISNNGQPDSAVHLKISDFGCCKRSRGDVYSVSSKGIGTLNYLAPELLKLIHEDQVQVEDNKVPNASDVFALGCVFFKFLTRGTHPFGKEKIDIPPNIINGKFDLAGLPSDHYAWQLISKMIAFEPADRPTISDVVKRCFIRIRQIGSLRGQGECAQVFSGKFRTLSGQLIQVAIKRISLESLQTDHRITEEIWSKLHYSNLVQLFFVISDKHFRYYVLELCDGTLEDYFQKKYKEPMADILDAFNQMARGLCYLHSRNMSHGDIKPENIFIISKSLRVQLKISIGCAQGTLIYKAPELVESVKEEVGQGTLAADIFSLGLVFFRFLDGRSRAIKVASPSGIPVAHRSTGRERDICYKLSLRMFSSDPNSRPNITEICSELQKYSDASLRAGSRRQRCYELNVRGDVNCCRFHPTEPKLACGLDGGRICLFSGATYSTPFGQWNKTVWKAETNEWIMCIDWKADGSKLAAGCSDGTVFAWEEDGTKSFERKEHADWVRCIQWNKADIGSYLFVTGSSDKGAIVWDSDRKVALQVFRFHSSWIEDVVWVSADQFASCSDDDTIKICRLGHSNPCRTFAHQRWIRSLRWSKSDRRLASCSLDGSIKIWSLDRDEPIVTLHDGGSMILCLDWHRRIGADGATSVRWWIAGGCSDGVVLVWDLQVDGEAPEPRRLAGHSDPVWSVAFSPDGEILASADSEGEVLLRRAKDCEFEDFSKLNLSLLQLKKWETIFQVQIGKMFSWQKLSFDFPGNMLAIPNQSPEVFVVEFDV